MDYPYRVTGIVWANPTATLPANAIIKLSKHLVLLGFEDFEPEGFDDHLGDMDDGDADEFWDNYEPSDTAQAAHDAEWDGAVLEALKAQFGATALSVGGLEPTSSDEPERIKLFFK